jgi:hypothetical protein
MFLLPFFEEFALKTIYSLVYSPRYNFEMPLRLLQEIFIGTGRDEVQAMCCRFFIRDKGRLFSRIDEDVKRYLKGNATACSDLLFCCFMLVDDQDHEMAMESVPRLKSLFPVGEGSVLLFKLSTVMPDISQDTYTDLYAIALLEYALTQGGPYVEKVKNYLATVPFCEWPIDDATMNARLLQFLRQEGKASSDNLEGLDFAHWDFIVRNAEAFDLAGVREFIVAHPRIFAKIDVSRLAREEETQFRISPVSESRLPSAGLFLKKGRFVASLSLAKSFFIHSSKPIPAKLFDRYVEIGIAEENKALLWALLEYSARSKIPIKSFDFDVFFDDSLFESALRALPVQSIQAMDLAVRKRTESKIGKKIDPELIHEQEVDYSAIISLDPAYFLSYLFSFAEYRAHRFVPLMKLMATISFDVRKVMQLIHLNIEFFRDSQSTRKRAIFMRFLSVCLNSPRPGTDWDELLIEVSNHLPEISTSVFPGFYEELSFLLESLVRVCKNTSIVTNVISSAAVQGFVLRTMAIVAIQNGKTLSESMLMAALKRRRPSQISSALRSVYILGGKSASTKFVEMARKLSAVVTNKFPKLIRCFLCGPMAIGVMSRLSNIARSEDFDDLFYASPVALGLATFARSLFFCSSLARRTLGVFPRLFDAKFVSPALVAAVDAAVRIIRPNVSGAKRKRLDLWMFQNFRTYFEKFVTPETCELFYKLAACVDDPLTYFYCKLPDASTNFLVFFAFLRATFRKAPEETKQKIRLLVNAALYAPESRNLGMRAISEPAFWDSELYLSIAGSETDEVEQISEEVEAITAS